jgi:pimeloyl-ACP methyl ester carboxylesterase
MNEEIVIDNLKINYRLVGQGQPVIILHGWGSSSNAWVQLQDKITERLSCKIVVPDLVGFGASDVPKKGWCMDNYVDWLEKFISQLSEKHPEFKQPIFLLGHSFGGRISVKIAARNTISLKGLILCNAAGLKSDTNLKLSILSDLAKSSSRFLDRLHLGRVKGLMRDFYYHLLRQSDYLKVPHSMRDTFRKVIEEDLSHCLSSIKQPTLIVWGSEDHIVPIKQAYRFYHEINNSELKVIPNVGHSPQLEKPDELAEIIIKFIQKFS